MVWITGYVASWMGYGETPLQSHLSEKTKATQEIEDASGDAIARHFLSSGLDYKGESSVARQTLGWGTSASGSGDMSLPFLPGLSLDAETSMQGAPYRFIIATVQPDDIQAHPNRAPLLVAAMNGYWGKLNLGITSKFDIVGGDDEESSSVIDWVKSQASSLVEYVGFSFKPELSLSAGASAEGTYLQACDKLPAWFLPSNQAPLREYLNTCFAGQEHREVPSVRGWDFNERCSFFAWNQDVSTKLSMEGSVAASIPALKELIDTLKEKGARQTAILWGLTGHRHSGKIETKLPTVELSYKSAHYRIQTWGYNYVVTTQDTTMTFLEVGGNHLSLTAELKTEPIYAQYIPEAGVEMDVTAESASIREQMESQYRRGILTAIAGQVSEANTTTHLSAEDIQPFGSKWEGISSATYSSAIACWHSEHPERLLPGSGFAIGQSICIPNVVRQFYLGLPEWVSGGAPPAASALVRRQREEAWANSSSLTYLTQLASKLRVSVADLKHVFMSPVVRETLMSWAAMQNEDQTSAVGAVVIEATFKCRQSMAGVPGIQRAKETGRMPSLTKAMTDYLSGGPGPYRDLEAIRVRVRFSDQRDDTSEVFKLGIKFDPPKRLEDALGVLGIKAKGEASTSISRVQKTELDGCFDLYTHWFGEFSRHNDGTAGLPPGFVAPTILVG